MTRKAMSIRMGTKTLTKVLGKKLRRSIRRDRRKRVYNASIEIERSLDAEDVIGAYSTLRHWYKKFSKRPEKPSYNEIEKHFPNTIHTR